MVDFQSLRLAGCDHTIRVFALDAGVALSAAAECAQATSLAGLTVSLFLLCSVRCSGLFFPLREVCENRRGNNTGL